MFLRFPQGRKKALTLSYDDGVEQDIRLMSLLDRHGIRCTFNLNSGLLAPENAVYPAGQVYRRMSRSAAAALYKNPNHEVAAHCLTHASLTELTSSQIAYEVLEDRKNLESIYGKLVRGFAYPFGTTNASAVSALQATGIAYARTVNSTGQFAIPQNWLLLNPTCHHEDPALFDLCGRFLSTPVRFSSELFYLWGHSYEFDEHDNWHIIERFCETMDGHEDIWYATNIEIVDYVNAYRCLISSADQRTFYNPTCTDVWVQVSGEILRIPAGKTVHMSAP